MVVVWENPTQPPLGSAVSEKPIVHSNKKIKKHKNAKICELSALVDTDDGIMIL